MNPLSTSLVIFGDSGEIRNTCSSGHVTVASHVKGSGAPETQRWVYLHLFRITQTHTPRPQVRLTGWTGARAGACWCCGARAARGRLTVTLSRLLRGNSWICYIVSYYDVCELRLKYSRAELNYESLPSKCIITLNFIFFLSVYFPSVQR